MVVVCTRSTQSHLRTRKHGKPRSNCAGEGLHYLHCPQDTQGCLAYALHLV